jgi:putative hydrolase of the HAD superfamily
MHDQSQPFQDALDFFYELKNRHGLQVVAVSNEGQELTEHRVEKFALRRLFDAFISSCFVHCRKPDEDMYRMALNVSQANPDKTVYIDDRLMFVEVAGSMGIRGIHHIDLRATRSRLADMNLIID